MSFYIGYIADCNSLNAALQLLYNYIAKVVNTQKLQLIGQIFVADS